MVMFYKNIRWVLPTDIYMFLTICYEVAWKNRL